MSEISISDVKFKNECLLDGYIESSTKKQYRTTYQAKGIRTIELYNNGKLISTEEYEDVVPMYASDKYLNRIAMLQEQGYTEGYTQEEVDAAKYLYEHKLAHLIKEENSNVQTQQCDKCNDWLKCVMYQTDKNKCPKYKKDPLDGGSY